MWPCSPRPPVRLAGLLALLATALPLQAQEHVAQEHIETAIDKGRAFLIGRYESLLARGKLAAVERVGQTSLSLYTLLKTGADPQSDLVRELVLHVSMQKQEHTYDAACTLLAIVTHDPMANRPWIDELAEQLVAWQSAEGDWAYPEGMADLSNAQFAALGLWAASRAGYEAPSDVWTKLARATLGYRDQEGGFGYSPGNGRGKSGTGSMTAAGVGTLAICEARLRRAKALTDDLAVQIAGAREGGVEWLAKNFSVTTNPRSGGWHFYYLYGLERVGAFVGTPTLGAHDWYDEGARFLVERQDESGAWNTGTDLSETCFALLFLRRATAFDAPRRGPLTGENAPVLDLSEVTVVAEGDGPVSFQVAGWNKKRMQELEWPGERGLGPRVVAVEYFVDDELVAIELGSPARPSGGSRFRTTHVFATPGPHELRARAVVRAPEGGEVVLQSAEVAIDVLHALPGWLTAPRPRALDNLLPKMKSSAKSSSVAKGDKAPFATTWIDEFAIDGNPRTPWLAAEKDTRRELTLQLSKGEKCRVVQVRAAVLASHGPGYLSRPVAIEVSINGKSRGTLAMSPDPLQPARLVLEEALKIQRIDLKITAVAPSDACPLVGIGEVELFAEVP